MKTATKSKRLPPFKPELRAAIRAGRKTMTRRIVKLRGRPKPFMQHDYWPEHPLGHPFEGDWPVQITDEGETPLPCPYGNVGDRVHLIEPLRLDYIGTRPIARYRDDGDAVLINGSYMDWRWKKAYTTSIHMPTEAARWFGRITEIRVGRVQSITEEDAIAEGISRFADGCGWGVNHQDCFTNAGDVDGWGTPVEAFQRLWEKINGAESWQANSYCWIIRWEPEQ